MIKESGQFEDFEEHPRKRRTNSIFEKPCEIGVHTGDGRLVYCQRSPHPLLCYERVLTHGKHVFRLLAKIVFVTYEEE